MRMLMGVRGWQVERTSRERLIELHGHSGCRTAKPIVVVTRHEHHVIRATVRYFRRISDDYIGWPITFRNLGLWNNRYLYKYHRVVLVPLAHWQVRSWFNTQVPKRSLRPNAGAH